MGCPNDSVLLDLPKRIWEIWNSVFHIILLLLWVERLCRIFNVLIITILLIWSMLKGTIIQAYRHYQDAKEGLTTKLWTNPTKGMTIKILMMGRWLWEIWWILGYYSVKGLLSRKMFGALLSGKIFGVDWLEEKLEDRSIKAAIAPEVTIKFIRNIWNEEMYKMVRYLVQNFFYKVKKGGG